MSGRSDFLDLAVRNQLAAEQRAHIDAQFAQMAHDADFQQEAEALANEFAEADWEVTRLRRIEQALPSIGGEGACGDADSARFEKEL